MSESAPHVIRLRALWDYEYPGAGGIERGSIVAEDDWLSAISPGSASVRFSRRFQSTPGLLASARVELVLSGLADSIVVDLNGHALPGSGAPRRHEILPLLERSNCLTFLVPRADEAPLNAHVWLEAFE
jgi:hypothetical protein